MSADVQSTSEIIGLMGRPSMMPVTTKNNILIVKINYISITKVRLWKSAVQNVL